MRPNGTVSYTHLDVYKRQGEWKQDTLLCFTGRRLLQSELRRRGMYELFQRMPASAISGNAVLIPHRIMSKYYYLVAGLPELTLEDSKLSYTVADFRKMCIRDSNSDVPDSRRVTRECSTLWVLWGIRKL